MAGTAPVIDRRDLSVSTSVESCKRIIRLTGALIVHTIPALETAVIDGLNLGDAVKRSPVVFDCRELVSLDIAGASYLVRLNNVPESKGVILSGCQPGVSETLRRMRIVQNQRS